MMHVVIGAVGLWRVSPHSADVTQSDEGYFDNSSANLGKDLRGSRLFQFGRKLSMGCDSD